MLFILVDTDIALLRNRINPNVAIHLKLSEFHLAFVDRPDKQIQDDFILKNLKNVESLPVKRRRSVGQHEVKPMSLKYFIQTPSKKVPVCRQVFLDLLVITKHQVNTVVKNVKTDGTIPKEKRGGDRKSRLYDIKGML